MAKKVATLEKVSKTYGKDDLIVKALDNVNLEIYEGDYLAVMGASGSGKSTAMNIIGCLDRPSQGIYKLNGTPVENLSDDQLAELRNQKLGFVFQQFHLLSDATALENVLLPMIYAGVNPMEREERAKNALDKVGLITGYTYDWKSDSYDTDNFVTAGQSETGVIAQEIEALGLPGITTTRDTGTKAVRYERLVPILIEAIKELEARVKTLEG